MARNHIASGALFKDAPIKDGKTHPIMHITLEVLGVNLNLAVWPAQTSSKGTQFWPVSGDYSIKETRRLVDVTPVMNAAAAPDGAPAAPAEGAEPAGDPESLPF